MKTKLLKKVRKRYEVLYFEKRPNRCPEWLSQTLSDNYHHLSPERSFYVIIDKKHRTSPARVKAMTCFGWRVHEKLLQVIMKDYQEYFPDKSFHRNKIWYRPNKNHTNHE